MSGATVYLSFDNPSVASTDVPPGDTAGPGGTTGEIGGRWRHPLVRDPHELHNSEHVLYIGNRCRASLTPST